jgi:SH3 domain protein
MKKQPFRRQFAVNQPHMRLTVSNFTAALLLLLLVTTTAQAETRYISDQLEIQLFSGEGVEHPVVTTLPIGEKVELLSSSSDSGFSKIRAADGTTGYLLTRQLMDSPGVCKQQTAPRSQKPDKANPDSAKWAAMVRQLKKERNQLQLELEEFRRTSGSAVQTANERRNLRKKVAALTWEVENLKLEKRELENDRAHSWFLVGAAVLILGIVAGLLLPRLQTKRNNQSWDSF